MLQNDHCFDVHYRHIQSLGIERYEIKKIFQMKLWVVFFYLGA